MSEKKDLDLPFYELEDRTYHLDWVKEALVEAMGESCQLPSHMIAFDTVTIERVKEMDAIEAALLSTLGVGDE